MKTPIRLLLADDHAVMRAGLANMLNANPAFCVVGEADDCETALDLHRKLHPDIVLLDVAMPGSDGIETLRRLRSQNSKARILMLSAWDKEEDVIHSLQGGASGYITKSAQPEELETAILACYEGKRVISAAIERRLSEQSAGSRLSVREVEVLNLLRKGFNNPDIARLLGITRRTVKAHVAAILLKLDAADRTEAVARGFEQGLLKNC